MFNSFIVSAALIRKPFYARNLNSNIKKGYLNHPRLENGLKDTGVNRTGQECLPFVNLSKKIYISFLKRLLNNL